LGQLPQRAVPLEKRPTTPSKPQIAAICKLRASGRTLRQVTVDLGERTRDALSHKRNNGERVGNIKFGYRLGADGKHVEPDPAEQAVLEEIGHLRRNGCTLRGSAAALNHRALRTRRGSPWRLEHVARIIKQGVAAH